MDDTMRDLLSKLDKILTETELNPKDPKGDYEEKKRALDDLQRDPIASKDPEISKAIIQRKYALEKEAKSKGFTEDQELYGLRIGDTVRVEIKGREEQGDIIDIYPETMEVELMLRGPEAGKTITVDVRDVEYFEDIFQVGDEFGISVTEDFEVGTQIVDILEDGIIVTLDETALKFLTQNGFTFEDFNLAEDKKKGVDGKACWKGYRYAGREKKADGSYKDKCVKVKEDESDNDEGPLTFQPGDDAHMTSLKGKIKTSYGELVDIFGEPQFGPNGDGDKITCEWIIDFSDGEVATIYDWKEEETPMHETEWHIGGRRIQAYWNVLEVFEKYRNLEDPKEYAEKSADLDAIEYGSSRKESSEDLQHNESKFNEAEYQGRNVPLGKPMRGDVKKSKVYVRKPNGKVVKVNFGDKKMRIKKSNPNRRKSFRARHNCANPGPRWKARYWSCKAW